MGLSLSTPPCDESTEVRSAGQSFTRSPRVFIGHDSSKPEWAPGSKRLVRGSLTIAIFRESEPKQP